MKRPAALLAIASVFVLAPLVWLAASWLLDVDSTARSGAAPAERSSTDAAQTAAPISGGPMAANADPDPMREVPAAAVGEAPRRTALGAERIEVQVVERSSGQPLPAARVRWAPLPAAGTWWEAPAWELDTIDAWMDAHGEPLGVSDDGLVFVPVPEDAAAVVVGQTSGLWGRARIEADAVGPQRLELRPDATLDVRTVDSLQAPRAGIPVALLATRNGWADERVRVVADELGAARLHHAGFLIHGSREDAAWSVAARVLLDEPAQQRLDPAALPSEPIVLVVPATGAVEVAVSALLGGPTLEGGRVQLFEGEASARPSFWSEPDRVSAPVTEGLASFAHVGLGLDLSVEARDARSTHPTRAWARGPAAPGETVLIEVVLGSDHPVLRLRLLDEEGRPLTAAEVRAQLDQSTVFSMTSSSDDLQTDAEGVLFYDLAGEWVEGGERTLALTAGRTENGAAGRAELDLARGFPAGLTDLGDVHLVSAGLLAAGSVEDAAGAPVGGARVSLSVPEQWGGDTPWYAERSELAVVTDEDGVFELRGPLESPSVRLRASATGLVGEAAVVAVGTTGVRLIVRRAGTVEGRLLVDEGVHLSDLLVQVRPAEVERVAQDHRGGTDTPGEDGAFLVQAVHPGLHDLVVRTQHSGDELASVREILVPEGASCPDPRLAFIDLRGRLCSFTLELVAPRAGASVSGVVVVRPSGGAPDGEGETTRFFQGERVPFAAAAPALDLEILAQGYRRVSLERVRDDVRVELEEGPLVRLRLPADVELPKPPRFLKAFVGPEEDFWTLGHMQDAVFGEDRELVVRTAGPGSLLVLWMLEERSESTLSTTSLGSLEPQTIDVRDQRGEQVFDVAPDPEAYAKALARWREG